MRRALICLLLFHMAGWFDSAASAQQGTAFTYQGQLMDDGQPANGPYLVKFELFDDVIGGNAIGSTIAMTVTATDGLLVAELDFGANVFDGGDRWLEISVDSETLSPRQPISGTPYSLQTRGISVGDQGNVGIKFSNSPYPLYVHADDDDLHTAWFRTENGFGVVAEAVHPGAYAFSAVNSGGGLAATFSGDVNMSNDLSVFGTLSKNGGSFKIDHPLDPENKFLMHSFVESPDMMNIYNGNVTTDKEGYATVTMPDWFEALNRDFRYQLTVVDGADSDDFVLAKVVEEIRENHFRIRTSAPSTKVSWQVTGVRADAWANAHRIPVEVDKVGDEIGRYLTPEVFGKGPEHALQGRPSELISQDQVGESNE